MCNCKKQSNILNNMETSIEQVNNEPLPKPFIPYDIEKDPLRNYIILEEENGLLTYLPIEMLTQEQIDKYL